MKGGDMLALGVARALAAPERSPRSPVLLSDEEWRVDQFLHV